MKFYRKLYYECVVERSSIRPRFLTKMQSPQSTGRSPACERQKVHTKTSRIRFVSLYPISVRAGDALCRRKATESVPPLTFPTAPVIFHKNMERVSLPQFSIRRLLWAGPLVTTLAVGANLLFFFITRALGERSEEH